jgi:serine/threonine-protein kinase
MPPVSPPPARLPLGTLVGPWRVLERLGLGAHGAVYRALHAHSPSSPVALKLALHPGNPRFSRERELLSRLHHPHVPRLLDHGEWTLADFRFPFLVMEWVDGVSLYDWAHFHRPSSRQVLLTLSRLASALAATHAAGGLHRDFKGDNVLVREADGWPFLTDFGSGHFLGAAPLSEPPFPPGTPYYRAPEAWRFVHEPLTPPAVPYAPTSSDDVFALGVTAYRLLTGEYPAPLDLESLAASRDEAAPSSPRALNPRCASELAELTVRMLSPNPEARGTGRELAEALEQAAWEAGPEADAPLFDREAPEPAPTSSAPPRAAPPPAPEASRPAPTHSRPTRAAPRGRSRAVRSRLTAASLGATVALGAAWVLTARPGVKPEQEHASSARENEDGGTVAVGDAALTAPVPLSQAPSAWTSVAVDLPRRSFPGQRRPDASGRCPGKAQVAIHGGCWFKLPLDPKDCEGEHYYVYKGGCYAPVISPARPPTSSPVKPPEDSPE